MPQDALAGGSIGVGIDESADAGIIIARLQIIEFSLSIVNVALSKFRAQNVTYSLIQLYATLPASAREKALESNDSRAN